MDSIPDVEGMRPGCQPKMSVGDSILNVGEDGIHKILIALGSSFTRSIDRKKVTLTHRRHNYPALRCRTAEA
jgi:hypothetical protein